MKLTLQVGLLPQSLGAVRLDACLGCMPVATHQAMHTAVHAGATQVALGLLNGACRARTNARSECTGRLCWGGRHELLLPQGVCMGCWVQRFSARELHRTSVGWRRSCAGREYKARDKEAAGQQGPTSTVADRTQRARTMASVTQVPQNLDVHV